MLADWYPSDWPLSSSGFVVPVVDLRLSQGSFFTGNIFSVWNNIRRVHAGLLKVAPEDRGNGRGRIMVGGLGTLAHKYAFTEVSAGIASQYSLDIFADVFGMGRMALFGLRSGGRDISEILRGDPKERLDIGYEEAREELVELEKDEKDLEDRQLGFYVVVGLDGLDTSAWDLPVEYNRDAIDLEYLLAK